MVENFDWFSAILMGAFDLCIDDFFATQIIGSTKELVVLLWFSGNI